jgi:hypothetical protein
MQQSYINKATIGQASNMAHAEYLIESEAVRRVIGLERYMHKRVPVLVKLLTEIQEINELEAVCTKLKRGKL